MVILLKEGPFQVKEQIVVLIINKDYCDQFLLIKLTFTSYVQSFINAIDFHYFIF